VCRRKKIPSAILQFQKTIAPMTRKKPGLKSVAGCAYIQMLF